MLRSARWSLLCSGSDVTTQRRLDDHASTPTLFAALDDERVGRYIGGPDVTTIEALHERIDFLAAGLSPSDPGRAVGEPGGAPS